jgi:hypothetical protein
MESMAEAEKHRVVTGFGRFAGRRATTQNLKLTEARRGM